MNPTVVVKKEYVLPVFPIFLVLLFLKVFGIVNISWFWVFFPIIFFPLIFIAILAFVAVCGLFALLIAAIASLF